MLSLEKNCQMARQTLAGFLLPKSLARGPCSSGRRVIGASLSGAGFAESDPCRSAWRGIAVFPLFTIKMSTYDGTLFALFITSILLPVLGATLKRKCQPGEVDAPVPASK